MKTLVTSLAILGAWFVTDLATPQASAADPRTVNIGGYLSAAPSHSPESFNAGFSLYTAAWPLMEKYQGHEFQSGLFGTWMSAQYDGPAPEKLYSDIEGGLGWWTDTRFPTETPKFIMGGVGPNFCSIANGPSHGSDDGGVYGVAQLSPWLLFPIDGLNVRQGTCGELIGYGYLALPLTPAAATTDGVKAPTGENSWTLFLNTKNFKGPVAFFTPYFWSRNTLKQPEWAGKLLDSRPAAPNKPISLETAYVPAAVAARAPGESYLRTAATQFPVDSSGATILVHRVTTYNKDALWNDVRRWFDGGPSANGAINAAGASVQNLADGGAEWKIWSEKEKQEPIDLDFTSFAAPLQSDALTFGYRWKGLATSAKTEQGSLVKLPEYFRLTTEGNQKAHWTPIAAKDVPEDTKLTNLKFDRPSEPAAEPYAMPVESESCWNKPGPVAGPFKARLGDGSIVTYSWYRFADQPALLNAGLTADQREQLQKRVEMLHRAWSKDRDYLPPPTVGVLCELDPALLVTPPRGKEIGYVPIATRQEWGGAPQPGDKH